MRVSNGLAAGMNLSLRRQGINGVKVNHSIVDVNSYPKTTP